MRWTRSLVIAGLMGLASAPQIWPASPPEVTATITPDRIGLNEIATFTITASGHGFAGLDLEPNFKLDDFETVAGPFRSESVRFVNGLTSRSLSLSWQLHPLHSGTARVKSIVVKARGRTIELPDQTIEVENTATLHPASSGNQGLSPFAGFMQPFSRAPTPFSPTPSPPRSMPEVFLQAVASPPKPFVGQQVLYTLYLYTQGDVDNIDPEEIPDF
ncbi:MAG TPA: BatD family protein, partial [Thermoanaerobaculia bacterium]|nr:BatD family protein [Thermoanaerobaculia bacterium]